MNSDGTDQRRIASDIVAKSTRGWSVDSRLIAFAARSDSNVDIYTVDVRSGRTTRLTSSLGEDRDPSWSPDGTQLAFSSTRNGTPQVHLIRADGSGERRLTNTASAVAPRWSPDGRSIAFVSDRDGTADLYLTSVDGHEVERLTVAGRVTADAPVWSPDGSRIAFQIANDGNYDIGVVRVVDGRRSSLASSPEYDGSYTWSPNGTQLAFISARDGFDGVYVADLEGHPAVRLTTTASLTPAWGSQR
jgi:Tol biopolymer transport system component